MSVTVCVWLEVDPLPGPAKVISKEAPFESNTGTNRALSGSSALTSTTPGLGFLARTAGSKKGSL